MDANKLHLFARGPGAPNGIHVGYLTFDGVATQQNAVQLSVNFHPPVSPLPGDDPYFVALTAQATSNSSEPGPLWGRWEVPLDQLPTFGPQVTTSWLWHLPKRDIEAIEAHHARTGQQRSTHIKLAVACLVVASGRVLHAQGDTYVTFPRSEWEDKVLTPLHYSLPPSWGDMLPAGPAVDDPAWAEAADRLAAARTLLRAGAGREALGAALDALESVVTAPYNPSSWLASTPDSAMPEQKREALASLFGGLGTYLNRVGHHRDRRHRDDSGLLQEMPADQWEAEYAVAAAQFLLTMAIRTSTTRSKAT